MRDENPADLDGDDKFDAIDLEIIEDGKFKASGNSGCGIILLLPIMITALIAMLGIS